MHRAFRCKLHRNPAPQRYVVQRFLTVNRHRLGKTLLPAKENSDCATSEIYLLVLVALDVPARTVTQVWEYRVNAGLRLRLARFELGLTALLRHRVELVDLHGSERLSARGNSILNRDK